ncbi:MAG TPA: Uma2 family endonuclease [Thermoanaerobaculia bacterium]|nr:Uma2 family endonuclease [Thermoanaerobaculia bacterium]
MSWEDYERILEIRGEHSSPRISYLEGELEIMSPGKNHELIKSYIGRLLEVWCTEQQIEFNPVGSWTLKNKNERRGAEADECYIFGTEMRERPQLAIEVEWTHGGIDKLAIYEQLGVDEVWYWRKCILEIYIFIDKKFVEVQHSRLFPELDLNLLTSMLDRGTVSQAMRDFRKALRSGSV